MAEVVCSVCGRSEEEVVCLKCFEEEKTMKAAFEDEVDELKEENKKLQEKVDELEEKG